jgi:hypothetical protein
VFPGGRGSVRAGTTAHLGLVTGSEARSEPAIPHGSPGGSPSLNRAKTISEDGGDGHACDDARIARAFLLVVGRAPTGEERDAARRFLETQPARYASLDGPAARRRAWADFCQMLLASDTFLYVE